MSPFAIDEQVFAQGKVRCVGQIIGVVAAEDQEVARLAATKVKVEYEKLPSILSIEDAINGYFMAILKLFDMFSFRLRL